MSLKQEMFDNRTLDVSLKQEMFDNRTLDVSLKQGCSIVGHWMCL